MKGLNYLMLTICVSFIIGIILAETSGFENTHLIFILLITLLACASIFHFILSNQFKKTIAFTILLIVLFIGLGTFRHIINDPTLRENHYTHFTDSKAPHKLIFTVKEVLNTSSYALRYVAEVEKIDDNETFGKILISLAKDSIPSTLTIGNSYGSLVTINPIPKTKNPYQFDYALYLKRQKIRKQATLLPLHTYLLSEEAKTQFDYIAQLRLQLQHKLKAYHFKPNEWGVINALLLGQRQELSPELRDTYAKAGVIHILAVSGLHVGILMLLVQWLLKPLGHQYHKRILRCCLVISIIWAFAIFTGLSPSVLRAATMFTFLQIGLLLNRKNATINALVISAFILLVIEPYLLFQVGFQLSYIAVFFIVWVQPALVQLWTPKLWILNYLWKITTVTLSAQFGVLALSIFYFHQFPGLFLIANTVVLPFLAFILGLGFLILFLAAIKVLPEGLANAFEYVLFLLNSFINWIASFDYALIEHIYISKTGLLSLIALSIGVGLVVRLQTLKSTYYFLYPLLLFIGILIYERYTTTPYSVHILHKVKNSVIVEKQYSKLNIYASSPLNTKDNIIKPLVDNTNVSTTDLYALSNYHIFNKKHLLVVDSLGIYDIPKITPDIILLTQSTKVNLERIIKRFPSTIYVADGSNYKTVITSWKNTCDKKEIPFHSTYEKGFYNLVK